MAKRTKKPSSKRYFLVYVYGGTDIDIIGRGLKTYEEVLAAARKMKKDGLKDGQDTLFYLITWANKPPSVGSFTDSELEDPEEAADHADLVRHNALGLNDGDFNGPPHRRLNGYGLPEH